MTKAFVDESHNYMLCFPLLLVLTTNEPSIVLLCTCSRPIPPTFHCFPFEPPFVADSRWFKVSAPVRVLLPLLCKSVDIYLQLLAADDRSGTYRDASKLSRRSEKCKFLQKFRLGAWPFGTSLFATANISTCLYTCWWRCKKPWKDAALMFHEHIQHKEAQLYEVCMNLERSRFVRKCICVKFCKNWIL